MSSAGLKLTASGYSEEDSLDELEPPEDAPDLEDSSDDAYTEGCFLLSFVCLGQDATVPGRHFPLQ